MQIVPDYSSKFNRNDIEQSYLVQGSNHMNMCKFSDDACPPYKDFKHVLEDYLEEVRERERRSIRQQDIVEAAEVTGQ